jgi:hypothetical protein
MPNRIIHEKALRSHTLANLSAEAERLFWRLTVVADDQGRFDAYPPTVKSDCFPTLVDKIQTKKIAAWMAELAQECCRFYTVDGRAYGYFLKWSEYQRVYGNKPKFPQPPADCGSSPQIPALILTPIPTSTTTSIVIDRGEMPQPTPKGKGLIAFPEDWKPSPEEMEPWKKHGINPYVEFAKFKDKALEKDRRAKDWNAAFRNWCRKAIEFKEAQPWTAHGAGLTRVNANVN